MFRSFTRRALCAASIVLALAVPNEAIARRGDEFRKIDLARTARRHAGGLRASQGNIMIQLAPVSRPTLSEKSTDSGSSPIYLSVQSRQVESADASEIWPQAAGLFPAELP